MSNDDNGLRPSLESSVPKEIFKSEVHSWAKKIGVEFNSITIRPMTTKWASCSSKGNLTFDTDLLEQPAAFRRKTIVHELLHLKYPKHNRMFKAMEKAYLDGDK
ncbi:MAG TPA: metal-dependent hydrolase [Anaerolineaceae bacterium]|nr:metal-dependent hydrolase [Anaerolineaceae bacterium]